MSKKITLLSIVFCMAAGGLWAQNYTVQEVKGRVQKESGSSRIDVNAGDILGADTVIITGVGASLILKDGDKTLTVPSARNGKVSELATSGVRISGNIARADTNAVTRTSAQVSTASARASDAAKDDDIAAE